MTSKTARHPAETLEEVRAEREEARKCWAEEDSKIRECHEALDEAGVLVTPEDDNGIPEAALLERVQSLIAERDALRRTAHWKPRKVEAAAATRPRAIVVCGKHSHVICPSCGAMYCEHCVQHHCP